MALTKITPQMFDTSAAGHDFNIDNGTFVVDSSANRVGIGTSSPSYNLHVTGSGDTVAAVTAGASSVAALNLGNDTNKADGGIRYDNNADALIFRASNTERMRIDSSGKVGIGTTSPNALLSLSSGSGTKTTIETTRSFTVNRNFQIAVDEYAEGTLTITPSTTLGGSTYTTPIITATAAGNVGIGTTSPGYPLEISAEGTVSFAYQRTGTGVTAKKWGFHSDNSNTYWQNITDSLLALTISNGGNVGIGTTAPARKLHIKDSGQIRLENTTTTTWAGLDIHTSVGTNNYDMYMGMVDSNGRFFIDVNSNGDDLVILQNGNVGIGTSSPDVKLDIKYAGDDPVGTSTRAGAFSIKGGHTSLDMGANDNSPYNSWIQTRHNNINTYPTAYYNLAINPLGGNVGIGTASPHSKLNVQGTSASTYTGSGPGTTIRASQSTDGNWIASDVDGKFAYFGVDGDNGKFAAYNYVSNAEMGVIIGQDTFKVVSEQAGIIQSDGDYVAKLHSTSADGYLSLYIGTATPTLKTKISSYGTSFFNSTTGQTAANQALVSIGAQTGKKAGYLNIDSAATSTSGGIRHKMSQGTQYLNVSSIHTASGSLPYWHIKTNIYYNQNIMFVARVHGYSYGNSGHIVDMQRSGYAYNGSSTSLVGSQFVNNGSFSSATLECYYTAAGQLCFRAYAGASSYYTGWAFDIKMQSPTGYNHDFVVDAHNMNATSGNYYT